MLFKEVKEYSNRKRINVNQDDGLCPGDSVIVMTSKEYEDFKNDVVELQDIISNLKNENQLLKNQERNLKEIMENITNPIYENHKKEMQDKELQIKQLTDELNTLKKVCSQYNLDMTGLNTIDIVIFRKHKKLINDFNNSIWVNVEDAKIIDADTKKITNEINNKK